MESQLFDSADDLTGFDAYLDSLDISEPMRGVYRRQLRDLFAWCEDSRVMLDEDVDLMTASAADRRYSLGAALAYWSEFTDSGYEATTAPQSPTSWAVQFDDEGDVEDTVLMDLDVVTAMDVSTTLAVSYERYLVSIGLSRKTITTYRRWIRRAQTILAELGGDLDSAGPEDLRAVADATPLTHSTRGQLRSGLTHYYDDVSRRDAPVRAVRVPPQPKMVNKALEPDETVLLLKIAKERWPEGGVVFLALYLGLRREEIAQAEWDRFDDRMEWYTVRGKRDKTAILPVHPVLRDELWHRRGTGYIFPGRKNVRAYISPATVATWIAKLADEAGIGYVTPHELRHTALTTALDNTEDLRAVMEWARHEKPETTVGYTRTTKDQLQRVSWALDWMGS